MMKVSVIGAGALGTFYAAMLKDEGVDVTLVCRERDVETLRQGIHITGEKEISVRPDVASSAPVSDLIFIAVKAYDAADAAKGLKLAPGTPVVIIHNGLGADEAAAAILGKGHVGVAVSYSGVTFLEPGKVRLAGYTETVLGSIEPEVREKLGAVAKLLENAGLKARVAEDLRAAQWEKMFANVGINAITAITGLKNGMLLEIPALKSLVREAVLEAGKVATVTGVKVSIDPVEGTYAVIRATAGNRSSMLQDVTRKKRTEIDYLNGKVSELGRKHGIATPVNDTITALVKGIEKRQP